MTEPARARGIRVLVADDSPQLRAAVGVLVGSRQGMVLAGVAGDAASVLAAPPVARPDVVLLDALMPGGGVTAAREISARWPGVAVVAVTAPDDPSTAAAMRSAGAVAFLVKGVSTVAEIEAAIRLAAAGPPGPASAKSSPRTPGQPPGGSPEGSSTSHSPHVSRPSCSGHRPAASVSW